MNRFAEITGDVDSVITAIIGGDRATALRVARSATDPAWALIFMADLLVVALEALREFSGERESLGEFWAEYLLHKAAGFPGDEEADR